MTAAHWQVCCMNAFSLPLLVAAKEVKHAIDSFIHSGSLTCIIRGEILKSAKILYILNESYCCTCLNILPEWVSSVLIPVGLLHIFHLSLLLPHLFS